MKKLSSSAPTTKDDNTSGNILMHHSRDTAEKQWAETRVLTLAGVARTFTAQRKVLQGFYSKIFVIYSRAKYDGKFASNIYTVGYWSPQHNISKTVLMTGL